MTMLLRIDGYFMLPDADALAVLKAMSKSEQVKREWSTNTYKRVPATELAEITAVLCTDEFIAKLALEE